MAHVPDLSLKMANNGVDPDLFIFAPVWRGGHAPVSGLICLSPEHDKQNKSGSKSKNDVGE